MRCILAVVFGLTLSICALAQRNIPKDLSKVRGFNYQSAPTKDHTEHWLTYNPAETERDLDFAKKLNLNQVRVFITYEAWMKDKAAFRKNLTHFVRAAHQRGIGVMPVVGNTLQLIPDPASRPAAREWAADLVNTIGKEPGLAFWDVMNEPELYPRTPKEQVSQKFEYARYMAGAFRDLDKTTPVTIGCAFVPCMEELSGSEDVLSFHDYLPTRAQIRASIARARQFSAKVGKPVFNTEIGCVGRANPYDVTLQEHMNAGIGWYIWELMITQRWGTVHGVFYPDGTVRDPSIAAALLGFFRNRGPDVILEDPDRESWVTRTVANGRKWLETPGAAWDQGLDIAETAANLLESAQLIAMHELPTRQVDLLRKGNPDLPALRVLLRKYVEILEPYQKK